MSFQNPAHRIARLGIDGMEAMWVKMFDPPNESRSTPDEVRPNNPVPEVMFAANFQDRVRVPNTVQRQLLHGLTVDTWDNATTGKRLFFMTFRDDDNPATGGGVWPGPTIRIPRGAVFHAETQGSGPPPHTIHWHGIEPTPMNDGVGHCSMEIGHYVYQFQPNFIGTYFYHCHRNTPQHFEFGLYGMLLIDPPDAFFATQVLGAAVAPIGHGRDGLRRTAANTSQFPQFPGFNPSPITAPDPWTGDARLKFATDPHAMTIPYDVEVLWVPDDRDSVWSDLGPNARATFPAHGDTPGVNDNFRTNASAGSTVGPGDFFALHDFNADYWFVTGVPVPAPAGGRARIPQNIVVPPQLNSGVTGMQVSINAQTGQTILVRCLNAAYNNIKVTFPVDIVIIAWDGRALGVPPYGMNHAEFVPAGTPISISVARRFDALIRSTSPVNDIATIEFFNTRGYNVEFINAQNTPLMTAEIPIVIGGEPQPSNFIISGRVTNQNGLPLAGVSMRVTPTSLAGTAPHTVVTNASGAFTTTVASAIYDIVPSMAGVEFAPLNRQVTVSNQDVTVPDFAINRTPRAFTPGSYDISEALDSLRIQVRLKDATLGDVGRYDVAPLPAGDNLIDLRDVLNVLRMAVELNPV